MPLIDHGASLSAAAIVDSYSSTGLGSTILCGDGERLSCWIKLVIAGGSAVNTVTVRLTGKYFSDSGIGPYVPMQSTLNNSGSTALEHAITVVAGNTYYHLLQTANQMGATLGVRTEAKGNAAGASDAVTMSLVSYVPDQR